MSDLITPGPGGPEVPFDKPSPKSRWAKRLLILVVLAGAIGGGAWYYLSKKPGFTAAQFRTVTVTRGDVVQEVTANGSLNPVKQVQVGAQVSGIIEKILVDFNSVVKQDQLLARIDPSTYQKNLAQARAQLAQAKSALELAQIEARRADRLFTNALISASDHDTAQATYHQAEANVDLQQAGFERATVDLNYTQIKAPISGVIITRAVDEGQTVASSFNTPQLFMIANDLTKMQIEAAVSEADVGGVEEGERVSFAVDAFPNRKFEGRVQQVRFQPITNQNVVTYTSVIQVDNPDLKLRPGMTATAKIVTAEKKNVLRVANSALRFRPPQGVTVISNTPPAGATNARPGVVTDSSGTPIPPWRVENRRPNPGEREKWEATLTPEQREKFQQMMQQMRQRSAEGGGGGPGGGPGGARSKPEGPTTETVYITVPLAGSQSKDPPVSLKAITVKAGATDGLFTEILDGLKEGDVVVTGWTSTANAAAAQPQQNPFSPFGGRRR